MRRLTPTEAERLQGYPDGWTEHGVDGKAVSDTKRYQMLGNSVAVPCVAYIMQGICDAVGVAWTKRIAEKSKDSNGENS
jgi:DNA (cytosine-5)-methyltransferase 1